MNLRSRNFWRWCWIAIRRSRVDKRARTIIIRVLFAVLYFAGCVLLAYRQYANEQELIQNVAFYGVIFGTAGIVAFLLRRVYRSQDKLLAAGLTGRIPRTPDVAGPPARIREYLENRTLILSSLIARAAGEIYLQHTELPRDAYPVTRRNQNEFLRKPFRAVEAFPGRPKESYWISCMYHGGERLSQTNAGLPPYRPASERTRLTEALDSDCFRGPWTWRGILTGCSVFAILDPNAKFVEAKTGHFR